jgi:small-conductance mechanosensitive channel
MTMADSILAVLIAVLAGTIADYALRRASRRIPVWLAQRRGSGRGSERGPERAALRRSFGLAGLAARAGVWVAVAWYATEHLAGLHELRRSGAELLARSFTAPLFSVNERSYSAVDLAALPLLLAALWGGVNLLVRAARAWLLAPAGLASGVQESVSVLLRYALIFPGAIVLLQIWGVDLRVVAILASVLGLGIGFGLQNIANNFVSGLLINLERPIRPGDFVHVGEFSGTVLRVGARSTQISTRDNVTILVPNARFLENEVINWSHGDPLSRVHVPVGVAYGSDPRRVRRVLLDVARSHPAVLREPRPEVELHGFGESSLDFELEVWTRDPRSQQQVVSDLNYRIHDALAAARIEIPFPQRDLRLRSPGLERLLARLGGEAAPEPHREAVAVAGEAAADRSFELERSPREWTREEVEAVVARMRGPGGIEICDRRYLLRSYARAFVGSEAVDWLVEREGFTRAEAIELGRRLVADGIVHHVLDEHGFRDGHFFYRFRRDEAPMRESA